MLILLAYRSEAKVKKKKSSNFNNIIRFIDGSIVKCLICVTNQIQHNSVYCVDDKHRICLRIQYLKKKN